MSEKSGMRDELTEDEIVACLTVVLKMRKGRMYPGDFEELRNRLSPAAQPLALDAGGKG